jgi:hypothetical protein
MPAEFTYHSESHLHGEVVVENAFPDEYNSLVDMIASLELPLRAVEGFTEFGRPLKPKRQMRTIGGAKKPFLLPVDQAALNGSIKTYLRSSGWSSEPVAAGGLVAGAQPLRLKGDFARSRVFVEVEFGNSASFYRDLFKFQIASRARTGDVGVLIAATDRLARYFDSGVTTFETATRAMPYMALGLQMPVWIIGIEPVSYGRLGERYTELWDLCSDNGLDCHAFDATVHPAEMAPLDQADEEEAVSVEDE